MTEKPSYEERECEACGIRFTPVRYNQKYCDDCKQYGIRIKRRIDGRIKHAKHLDSIYNPTIYTKTCQYCGNTFRTPRMSAKFCRPRCKIEQKKTELFCDCCGAKLSDVMDEIPDNIVYNRYHYCNETCEATHKQQLAIEKYGIKTCKQCGKTYSNPNKEFCCRACMNDYYAAQKAAGIKQSRPREPKQPPTYTPEFFYQKHKTEKPAEPKNQLQDYIKENGLCSVCRCPYPDCERMTSNFRIIPKGARYIDNKIQVCPKYIPPKSKKGA